MKRILLSLILLVSSAPGARAVDLPNIVYIMSDELAYYELSHMGNDRIHTPNIDRMAKEGIRFYAGAGSRTGLRTPAMCIDDGPAHGPRLSSRQ